MYLEHVHLNRPGVTRLDKLGSYAVFANKKLLDRGMAHRFAVANTHDDGLDSVHGTLASAEYRAHQLYQAMPLAR